MGGACDFYRSHAARRIVDLGVRKTRAYRRAKKRARTVSLQNKRRYLWKRQKGKCAYCGQLCGVGKRRFTVDHIVPIAKGGTDDFSNLAGACGPCNADKADRSLDEWRAAK